MEKAKGWMEKAAKAKGCERWKYVGIASHYFFDSKCIWHQVMNEDYYSCHKPFEDEAGEKIRRHGLSDWSVCKCGACVAAENFKAWLEEFYAFADGYLQPKTPTPAPIPTADTPIPIPTTTGTPIPTPTADTPEKRVPKTPGFDAVAALFALVIGPGLRKFY